MLSLLLVAAALADDSIDPTSASGIVELVVKFGIAPVGFGAIVFWLVRYHIPSQQATFKEVITGQQVTFKDAITAVVADHKEGISELKASVKAEGEANRNAIKAEGDANRESRRENSENLRKTLTGMSTKGLRAAAEDDDEDDDPSLPVRRRTAG